MTQEDIYKEYIKVFALLVEDVGEEKAYKSFEDSAKQNELVKQALSQDAPFEMFIFMLISCLLQDVAAENEGFREKIEAGDSEFRDACVGFWEVVLKKHTLAFAKQRGIPIREDIVPDIIAIRNPGEPL